MITSLIVVVASVMSLFPVGIEFECRSWTGARTKLSVTVVAADGSKNEGSMADISGSTDVEGAQAVLEALLEMEGWDVRTGPNDTVIVFAPKGQSVKSVKIESTGWSPGYKRVLGPPIIREQPKVKKP